ncbi:CLUMA_CG018797, isoform A [Clunio marinus]|uniref:[histone H4]-lysine(20) N-methyltransferase n=1 Tax=Clunio marinus TaxID=568069 RepID=A0A1J1J4H2_9DIPT|nr:CLUMA_CG018797, isoform A [Clunio marinus]
MVRGRKPRAQKSSSNGASATPTKKVTTSNLLVSTLFNDDDNQTFNSPKRKETKIDGVLMENGAGKSKEGSKAKPFRPATRSTRKINEYFARLPANGIIRVQNGHNSHSDDSCDSLDDQPSTENDPPSSLEVTQSKQLKMTNGPVLLPEAQAANNLFLQEPVLKLQFDKNEAVTNGAAIKTSFLSTEITGKFQTLPPTEYINKVLNVNGSHDDDVVNKDKATFLLNSDSNSSDSGVVIGDEFMKSPVQLPTARRRKPVTPHRMILCPSPVKSSSTTSKITAELIKASRTKSRAKVKLEIPSNDDEKNTNVIHQDHDYDGNKIQPQAEKPFKAPSAPAEKNKKVTEFFTVRRSVRKTKKEVQEERMKNIERAIKEGREEGLEVRVFDNKGRGIVTTRSFQRGEFVIEYIGDLISMSEANEREVMYATDDNTGCYMYYFKHNDQQYCIDATEETGKLGRLVNHSRNGNLMTKTVMVGNRPHLVLIAKEDLSEGVELTYDYGDRSKEALQHHPWLAL